MLELKEKVTLIAGAAATFSDLVTVEGGRLYIAKLANHVAKNELT